MTIAATPAKRRQRWHLWTIRGVPYYLNTLRHRRAQKWGWEDYVFTGQTVLAAERPVATRASMGGL